MAFTGVLVIVCLGAGAEEDGSEAATCSDAGTTVSPTGSGRII